jgi:ATP-dependent exoDNAse (exonuclease V) beta subunit
LIISSGPDTKKSSGNFIGMLDKSAENQIGEAAQSRVVTAGAARLEVEIVEASLTAPGRANNKRKAAENGRNWQRYLERWKQRRHDYETALGTPAFVTPTALKRQEQEVAAVVEAAPPVTPRPTTAMLVGELAHGFLEHWDFRGNPDSWRNQLAAFVGASVPPEFHRDSAKIRGELEDIFDHFFASEICAELTGSRVIGREVPLLMPWESQIMEGVIDVIYERNGLLYLADYKTDRIDRKELRSGAERYRHQAEIYSLAARRSLKREVAAFKVIFLRLGEAIEVDLNSNKQLGLF